MSLVGETTFSQIGNFYCKCEWLGDEKDGEMFLTVIHSGTAWTAKLDKSKLVFGNRARADEGFGGSLFSFPEEILPRLHR